MSVPDWEGLHRISAQAERESKEPGWNINRWRELVAQAKEAAHGFDEAIEFMMTFRPEE